MISRISVVLFILVCQSALGQTDITNIGTLPGEVIETSGLIFFNDKLITHNDSGNTPQLFEIDTVSKAVTRTVTVENAINADWEDLSQDENYIYIGDFGNNLGRRQDLLIYRIAKSDYIASESVTAETIAFNYEDQTDFSGNQNSDWDAEAFVVLQDQLVIFTKQWQSNGTVAYSIPKTPGNHIAQNLGGYDSGGLITAATYNELSEVLFLLGYSQQLQPFVIRMEEITDVFVFNNTIEKIPLTIGFAQVEGIGYVDENTYYVSSERFTNSNPPVTLDASLFRFNTTDTKVGEPPVDPPVDPPIEPPVTENPEELIIFFPNSTKELHYELNVESELFGRAIFDVSGRLIRNSHASEIENNTIDLSIQRSAVYYLTFYVRGRTISKPFVLN